MSKDHPETLFSSFRRFLTGTSLSRFSGFFREVVMAATFGTSPAVAAFWMAFRFSHLFRRIFGEGGLHVAFVPHFESLRKKDPSEAAAFFSRLSLGLAWVLLLLALIGALSLGGALFFCNLSEETRSILRLTLLMLPSFLFVSLYALNASLLQCEGIFFLPSVAPVFFNLMWAAAIFFLPKEQSQALNLLAIIIVSGLALQWLVTWIRARKIVRNNLKKEKSAPSWKEYILLLKPFSLAIIGVAAVQINSALDALFARFADAEGPAILWYAIRLEQLPLALFGVGMSAAFFPSISRAAADAMNNYLPLINLALRKAFALMIPLTFGLFAMGLSGVAFTYGRGEFQESAIRSTTEALWAYGVGLLPSTLVFILASSFYAIKEYRIPTMLSLLSVLVNGLLNALFVFGFHGGAISIAYATSISALLNALFLMIFLHRRIGTFTTHLGTVTSKSLIASLIATTLVLASSYTFFGGGSFALLLDLPLSIAHGFLAVTFQLFVEGMLFMISFVLTSLLMKNHELFDLILPHRIKRRIKLKT